MDIGLGVVARDRGVEGRLGQTGFSRWRRPKSPSGSIASSTSRGNSGHRRPRLSPNEISPNEIGNTYLHE
jgi:hypothetical protein